MTLGHGEEMDVEERDHFLVEDVHERTISLRFLGLILSVLKLEVSVYNVYKPV
jgi:hypothetical protein